MPTNGGEAKEEQPRPGGDAGADESSANAIRKHLEKVLSTRPFINSPQLCRFLRFVVEQEINGQGDQLKEYLVATEVLGKGEDFDPRIDTVVRTEARRLRRKLTEYYQSEGVTDTIEIDLPKGAYRPAFRMRSQTPSPMLGRPAPTAEAPVAFAERSVERAGKLQKFRRLWLAGACVLMIGLAVFWLWGRTGQPDPRHGRQPSIAVLPLENLSADPDQEYFSDGMTDALITSLAGIHGLRVISRTSVLQYKRVKKPLSEIARQLGAEYIVEGAVQRTGDRVRITSQLIAVPNERHLWAEAYERDRKDALSLQVELARTIADQIGIHVTQREPAQPGPLPVSPEAQDNYLKGRYNWHTRRPAELLKSVEFFQLAIAKEPRYALAYAGLSDSYSVLSGRATGPDRKSLSDRAREAAITAIALDENLGDAHASLAVSSWDWTWEANEREFRRALDLSPGNATAHQWYAGHLVETGRIEEGLIEARRAVELSPMSPSPNQTLGWALYMGRQYDRAIRHFQSAIEAFPDFLQSYSSLGIALEAKGMHRQAIDVLEKAMKLTGGAAPVAALLMHVYAGAGDRSKAQHLLEEFRRRGDITPILMALLYMDVGDKDHAFEWFDKGIEQHSMFVDELKVEPMYDSLRSDPRFTALLRKMRLAP